MNKKEKIVKAFLEAKFQSNDLDPVINSNALAPTFLKTFNAFVDLEIGETAEDEEYRSITVTEDTDGSYKAESIKLYNLMKISFYDLFGFLAKETSIGLTEDTAIKFGLSMFNLIYDFYPKLKYTFNATDAKILYSIYKLNKKEFTIQELSDANPSVFSEEQLNRSFNFYKDLRIVKYLGNDRYLLKEKVIYERN